MLVSSYPAIQLALLSSSSMKTEAKELVTAVGSILPIFLIILSLWDSDATPMAWYAGEFASRPTATFSDATIE